MTQLIEVRRKAVLFKRWYFIKKPNEPKKEITKELSNKIFNSMKIIGSERTETEEEITTTMQMQHYNTP